jgi:hypothetical protein
MSVDEEITIGIGELEILKIKTLKNIDLIYSDMLNKEVFQLVIYVLFKNSCV